ncbi:S-layer homology domain-containing protein [Paenibacillus sp. VCA1]|uniref:S-layer homology domain-containing protein n=1 Tax=Paenibacillus sp. VCA1 TaxID=3039148 RepID=UPI0028726373|nr:S-layer homology domain-containing protein [Paenibacillus sp. VCA1]MDR9854791.1 S-layer homology domain-containing protein [Paenibacillus sp. VCA1]
MNRTRKLRRSVSIAMLSGVMLTTGTPAALMNAAHAEPLSVMDSAQQTQLNQPSGIRLDHTPPAWIPEKQNYTVTAVVYGVDQPWSGQIRFSVDGKDFGPVELKPSGQQPDTYTGDIPGETLIGRELKYSIDVLDSGGNVIRTGAYSTAIRSSQAEALAAQVDAPALLITEMVPDTADLPGSNTDAYEFVEVYNNTDQDVNFKDYSFFYNNSNPWTPDPGTDIIIPARQPVVFWIMNGKNDPLTADQFNANFGTNLVEGVNLFRISGGGGMANGSARTLAIKGKGGETIVSAAYEPQHVKPNMGIFFKHPVAGSTLMTVMSESGKAAATPGKIDPSQAVPPVIEEGKQTEITHTPADVVKANDYEIKAHVNNPGTNADGSKAPVKLLYKTPSQARYTVTTMTDSGNTGDYTATIPAAALAEPTLQYRILAGQLDKPYTTRVNMDPFDPSKAPVLLVTELVPNTANVPGTSTDAYEYIEVYNNSDQPVNFKNYKIYYRYPDKGPAADVEWPSVNPDFVIAPKQSVVFWIKNSANTTYTENDFNQFYKTNLIPGQTLQSIQSDGMANSGRRAVVIKTNTGREISSAYYDADLMYEGGTKGDETKEDKAIVFGYPMNGGTVMIKAGSGTDAPTPGSVTPSQVPAEPVHVVADTVSPTVQDATGVKEADQSKGLELKADAKDDREVTSVEVFVRSDKQAAFTGHRLTEDYNDMLYHYKLSSADLIGRKFIEYYFVVSDGVNETKSDLVRVAITGGVSDAPLRLNVKDQEIVKGIHTVKGTSEAAGTAGVTLSIDGKKLPDPSTYAGLEHDAYFVFDAVNVDYYFKNAVTMGPPELEDKTILYTFMDPITTYTTLSFPIGAERLKAGDNVIYIRAGSKSSPFDKRPEENKDDFEVKNVRLLLADGTEIWDPAYAEKEKQIKMGDSAGKSESIGFHFDLKPEHLKAKAYDWDTTAVPDGAHQVAVSDGTEQMTANVIVDNTAPTIKPTVEEGKEYRGEFVIDAEIEDALAGVDKVTVKLDDKPVELPFKTSSGEMKGGTHKLYIQAADRVGNISETTVNFKVPDENPLPPELVSPKQGQTNVGTDANLTVKVQDPNQDPLNVTFYKGYKYDGSRAEGFSGYMNTSVTEPPKEMAPAGEQAMGAADYEKISAVDGKYLVNDSVEQFPYQRFEVKLDPSVKSTDRVDIEWKGKSLEGRKVSLYAWSPSQGKWVQLDQVIAGADDFGLNAVVKAGDYASGQVIEVMVQDEIAVQAANSGSKPTPESQDPYDFSFVWMSDTQYYSQSYPQIYQKIVNWVVEQKDKMNIKYVIHTGDVVDKSYQEYQWIEADKDMKVLEDANIPYGVLAGNHDVDHQNNDYTKFKEYFGENRFKNNQVFGGSYDNNRGHYDLVSSNGNDFIIVYMGWGLGDKEIEWMNEVVSKYPERKAILCLHEYLLVSNNRAPIADQIFEKVVKPNKNVIAALSGHYHDAELKVDQLDDNGDGIPDRSVYQMLADYQGAPEGGLGYIRLMQFDMKNNKLHIKTYSPYLDDYNYYDPETEKGKDEFSLDLGLEPATKRVATDYIGVKVYTDQQIGAKSDVPSGTETSVAWKGLPANSYEQWYVKAEDEHSGSALSDIWGFYTGVKSGEVQPPGGGGSGGGGSQGTNPGVPNVPKPPVTEAGNGQITIMPSSDGAYHADAQALEQAVTTAGGGKVVVELAGDGKQDGESAVYLPAGALKKAKDSGLSVIISAPGLTVTLPAASMPDQLEAIDQLLLRIDTSMTSVMKQKLSDNLNAAKDYSYAGLVYSLRMIKLKGQTETEVTAFGSPVTIERSLSAEQQKQLQSDYAGVYLLDRKPVYKGGSFRGGAVTFAAGEPGSYAVLEYRKQFVDVKGSWAEEYISKLTAKHLIQGVDEEHYSPSRQVTRADFITLVMRGAGVDLSEPANTFTDVPADAYYAAAVAQASKLGIVQGSGGKFRPQDPVSREEAAVILMKASDARYGTKPSGSANAGFTDMNRVSSWAKEAVERVNGLGLMTGKGNLRFDPKGNVTRAEMAKMVYMLMNKE